MVAYLADGWFAADAPRRLRAEVVDGALDSAGFLHRASLDAAQVLRLALRVRALGGLLDPLHRHVHLGPRPRGAAGAAGEGVVSAGRALGAPALQLLRDQLAEATDACVELQSFVLDCLDHVADLDALRGLFLHLAHVAHLMRLLAVAQKSAAVHALLSAAAPAAAPHAPAAAAATPRRQR